MKNNCKSSQDIWDSLELQDWQKLGFKSQRKKCPVRHPTVRKHETWFFKCISRSNNCASACSYKSVGAGLIHMPAKWVWTSLHWTPVLSKAGRIESRAASEVHDPLYGVQDLPGGASEWEVSRCNSKPPGSSCWVGYQWVGHDHHYEWMMIPTYPKQVHSKNLYPSDPSSVFAGSRRYRGSLEACLKMSWANTGSKQRKMNQKWHVCHFVYSQPPNANRMVPFFGHLLSTINLLKQSHPTLRSAQLGAGIRPAVAWANRTPQKPMGKACPWPRLAGFAC